MRPARVPCDPPPGRAPWAVLGLFVVAGLLGSALAGAARLGQLQRLSAGGNRPVVVVSLTILEDLTRQLAGERVGVHSLLGPGQDPHTYEPTPADALAVQRAARVLVNGYDLDLWAERLAPEARRLGRLVRVAERVPARPLPWPGAPDRADPHLWMDPLLAAQYVQVIEEVLRELDPGGAPLYRSRAQALEGRLQELDRWIRHALAAVPAQRRLLVTTHDAYRYFGRRYGLVVLDSLWGISTEEEPSAHRLARLFRRLREYGVPVFVETTVNPQLLREIAAQAGVTVGGKLYADALGPPGSGAETYVDMMRHNVRTLVEALSAPQPPR